MNQRFHNILLQITFSPMKTQILIVLVNLQNVSFFFNLAINYEERGAELANPYLQFVLVFVCTLYFVPFILYFVFCIFYFVFWICILMPPYGPRLIISSTSPSMSLDLTVLGI